jgi:phi LC3 family holin
MKKINIDPKFKNPYFWISVFAVIFSASGIAFEDLTSWKLLGDAIMNILNNPVSILAIIISWLGIFNDNSSQGLDKLSIKKKGDK